MIRPSGSCGVLVLATSIGFAAAEKVSDVDAGVSIMLMGSVGFMMALFELTHCYRKSMAKYSWKAISATISIFSAVLIFQGVNGIVEYYILEGSSETVKLTVNIIHFLAWFVTLQWVLALISGAVGSLVTGPQSDEDLEIMETRLKCYAVLFGHITGFAAINAFATIQQIIPRNVSNTLMVPLLAWLCVFLLGRVTDHTRDWISLADDGKKDICEEKWEEETAETEDDVIGLAVSFCLVQVMRFAVGGVLPNAEGEEPNGIVAMHTDWEVLKLISIGVVLVVVETIRIVYVHTTIPRLTTQLKNIIAMAMSWSLYFGLDWFVSAHLFRGEQGMMKQVILALVVTVAALACIFFLEALEELESTGERFDGALRAIVNAIGIMIGFAWERSFDEAVAEVSETVPVFPEPLTKLLLAIGLAGLVVPAWKRHILPTILKIEAEEEEKDEHIARETEVEEGILNKPLLGTNTVEGLEAACETLRMKLQELGPQALEAKQLKAKNEALQNKVCAITKELNDLGQLAKLLVH